MKNTPERNRERSKEWRRKNPLEPRRQQLWYKFGMTVEQYEDLVKGQKGLCAICHHSCPSGRALAVDHCHTTNKIRGLLCMHCNQGLGKFKDNITLMENAIKYLRKYG